jgi:hypothetical protein
VEWSGCSGVRTCRVYPSFSCPLTKEPVTQNMGSRFRPSVDGAAAVTPPSLDFSQREEPRSALYQGMASAMLKCAGSKRALAPGADRAIGAAAQGLKPTSCCALLHD